jgi:AAA family ATP:ADP antiporter
MRARLRKLLDQVVEVRPEERRAVLWAFLFFLCVLTSYYVLRAVREERAVAAGIASIPRLFRTTFYVILALTPLWAALVARVRRSVLLPLVYRFFVVNLLGFYVLFKTDAWALLAAKIFFVWLSVYSLIAVAVFWSFMADLFREEQGRRLFGFISAGGSAGAIVGPLLTSLVVERIDPASLLLVSAALIEAAARCVRPLERWQTGIAGKPVGGSALAGIGTVFSSPFLLGVTLYVALSTMAGTFGYVMQARLVAATTLSPAARTALFARMDLVANAVATLLQTFVVGRLLTRVGVTAAMAVAPPIMAATFALQGLYPVLAVSTAMQIARRALAFGITVPSLKVLFTVVSREQKYKAQAFIDTVVYRAGDVAGSSVVVALLDGGLGLGGASFALLPLVAVWWPLAFFLGRRHARLLK